MSDVYLNKVEHNGNVMIIARGILDITTTEDFRCLLKDVAEAAESLTVDLTAVRFIDTASIVNLASTAMTTQARGKPVKIVVKQESHPLHVLSVVGLDEVAEIEIAREAVNQRNGR